jgi:RNA recognition motif-containing protein
MGNKIYVGGLPYATTDAQLQEIFSAHGTVEAARVIMDSLRAAPEDLVLSKRALVRKPKESSKR